MAIKGAFSAGLVKGFATSMEAVLRNAKSVWIN